MVDLNCRDMPETLLQNVGDQTGTGTDFQDILTKLNAFKCPWKNLLAERFLPQPGSAEPTMYTIHMSSDTSSSASGFTVTSACLAWPTFNHLILRFTTL